MSDITKLLRRHIASTGKTRDEVAGAADIAVATLDAYLNGTRTPSEATAHVLATKAFHLKEHEKEELIEVALSSSRRGRQERRVKTLQGIDAVHEGLPYTLLKNKMCEATKRIWILETWVVDPLSYKDAFIRIASSQTKSVDFSFRILFLNPQSGAAEQRSKDVWLTNIDKVSAEKIIQLVPSKIRASIEEFKSLSNLTNLPIDIRLYDHIPPFSAYICDDTAFVGFYIHGEQSNSAPQLQVILNTSGGPTYFGNMIITEFNTLWEVSS